MDPWSEYAAGKVINAVRATGFVRFTLRWDEAAKRRVVEPRHYVVDFPVREQGRQRHHSALLTLRVVQEEEVSRDPSVQGAVANHLRCKPAVERKAISGADEYVEFELLSREHEVPSQQPLRISMGPVRANKKSGQQEFVQVDMGQCIQWIATDIVDHGSGQRLVQNRWWMCIATLRLLCIVDHIDCKALDKADVPPQEWVIRLVDVHAPVNRKEEVQVQQEDRHIDDLMQFIDKRGPNGNASTGKSAKAGKAKKKKNKDKDGGPSSIGCSILKEEEEEAFPMPSLSSSLVKATSESMTQAKGAEAASSPIVAQIQPASAAESLERDDALQASTLPPPQDAVDVDLMGELLQRYRRLQERSSRAELDARLGVIRELLEVLDELLQADTEIEDSIANRTIFSAARKFEAKLCGLGCTRIEALGKPFDQQLHRLIGEAAPAPKANQVVVEELLSGWIFGNELIRPALVSLG